MCAGLSPAQAAKPKADRGLAFVVPGARIVTAQPDGSDPVQVSSGPGKDLDPAYSRDGTLERVREHPHGRR